MKTVNYSEARKNFRFLLDYTAITGDTVCVVSRGSKVIMVSKEDYDELLKISTTRDEYGNPPGYKSTFIKDAIKNATDKLKDK